MQIELDGWMENYTYINMKSEREQEIETWKQLVKFHQSEAIKYLSMIKQAQLKNAEINKRVYDGNNKSVKTIQAEQRKKRDLD